MNIDVVGRIYQNNDGGQINPLQLDGNHRISAGPGEISFAFQNLFVRDKTNYDVFRTSVEPLLEFCIAGFNTCFIVAGETGSGKTKSLYGEGTGSSGLVSMVLERLFNKIGEGDLYMQDTHLPGKFKIEIQMYEIFGDQLRDLLQLPGVQSEFLELGENAELGVHVRNGKTVLVQNAAEAISIFRQGWARRSDKHTDYGSAKTFSTILFFIDVALAHGNNPYPNRSRFTMVHTPGMEKLQSNTSQHQLTPGAALLKPLLAFTQLIAALANQPYPDRVINYRESRLTSLLKNELGGNCQTRVLLCLKQYTDRETLTSLLTLANQFSKVKNFPVLNEAFTQQLLTQYRAQIVSLQEQLGIGLVRGQSLSFHNTHENLQRTQIENVQLKDQNERLHHKLDQLQGKFGYLATSKTDLSGQLLLLEEEKLKISKTLVEMEIENNKLKEEGEAAKFELTNKIIKLEQDLMECQMDRDKHLKSAKNAKEKLSEVEQDRKELADEYITLKSNYVTLKDEHNSMVAKNEELGIELLNLVNAKASLMRQMKNMELATGHRDSPSVEVERVRAIVSRMSLRRPDLEASEQERDDVEKNLFGNQDRFNIEMTRIRNQYDENQRILEKKLKSLRVELEESRFQARDRQRKISELNARLITLGSNHDHLLSENNRLQHKMKDVNSDFRSRLIKYLEDAADYVDRTSSKGKEDPDEMKKSIQKMLKDLSTAHKAREEQLSKAAQSFSQRLRHVVHRHEELLVAYRQLRQQVESHGLDELDLGPDEEKFALNDKELNSYQQQEIHRLRDELEEAKGNIEAMKIRLRMPEDNINHKRPSSPQSSRDENWNDLHRQIKDFAQDSRRDLEQERAALLTKVALLESENDELQQYIDNHLIQYKEEIVKLRQMLGVNGSDFASPSTHKSKHKYRK